VTARRSPEPPQEAQVRNINLASIQQLAHAYVQSSVRSKSRTPGQRGTSTSTSPSRPPRQSQKGKAPSARNSTATLASLTRCVSPCAIGAHHRRRVEARLQLGATLRPADDASVIASMKVYSPLVYSCRPGGHCSSSSGGDSTCSIGGGRRPPLHAASGDAISSGRGRNVLARVVVACKHSLSATPELPPRSVSFAA